MRSEIALRSDRDERTAVLARTAHAPEGYDGTWIHAPEDARGYAHGLYANLRSLDDARADAILIESVPGSAEWFAIGDRLSRATRGEEDRDGINDAST